MRAFPGAFVFSLCFLLIQLALYFSGILTSPGRLLEADGYTRLLRAEHLWETGRWFDPTVPRSNPTHPETIQWSRLIDTVLLAGGVLASPFCTFHQGLFWWGVLFSPVVFSLAGPALLWASSPLFPQKAPCWLLLLLFSQPALLAYTAAGRPDHHAALLLLHILLIGLLLRGLDSPTGKAPLAAAGLVQALALAVSIEALVSTAIALASLGFPWLARRSTHAARNAAVFTCSLLAGSLAGILISIPPAGWNMLETDRLAPAYLAPLGFIACFWFALACFEKKFPPPSCHIRLIIALAGMAACLAFSLAAAPALLKGPFGQVDPRALELWVPLISEYASLSDDGLQLPGKLLFWLGCAFFGLLVTAGQLALFLKNLKNKSPDFSFLYCYLGLVVYFVLAFVQLRWCTYAAVFGVLTVAPWGDSLLARMSHGIRPPWLVPARFLTVFFFCAGPLLFSLMLARPAPPGISAAPPSLSPIGIPEVCEWLNQNVPAEPKPERLLAFMDYGTELAYRTRHEVIATPNHRNADGILFFYDTLNISNEEQALQRLKSKEVTLLLLGFLPQEQFFLENKSAPQASKAITLYQQLHSGRLPNWLEQVPMPERLGKTWHLYRIQNPEQRPPIQPNASDSPDS